MGSFEDPFNIARHQQDRERHIELIDQVRPLLLAHARTLKKLGVPVDGECRIDPLEFSEIYPSQKIAGDHEKIGRKKETFAAREIQQESPELGTLLENLTTILFNTSWFKGKLLKVRASEFDDYVNGVDQLIIDPISGTVLAAVDETTTVADKAATLGERLKNGKSVTYGLRAEKGRFIKGQLSNLPLFLIQISPDDVMLLAQELIDGKRDSEHSQKIGKQIIQQMLAETDAFKNFVTPEIRSGYDQAKKILTRVVESGSAKAASA